jgi:hypothetical protein
MDLKPMTSFSSPVANGLVLCLYWPWHCLRASAMNSAVGAADETADTFIKRLSTDLLDTVKADKTILSVRSTKFRC